MVPIRIGVYLRSGTLFSLTSTGTPPVPLSHNWTILHGTAIQPGSELNCALICLPCSGAEPPSSLPYLVTLRHFADWFRATNPREVTSDDAIDSAFKEYRQGFLHKLNSAFFEEMHRKPWFKEKYSTDKEMGDLRAKLKAKGREGRLERFLAELEEGKLDELSFDYQCESWSAFLCVLDLLRTTVAC